jgi:hypothetical protein
MKRLFLFIVTVSASGCVSNESPIALGPAFPMTGTSLGQCTLGTVGQTGGSFDTAGLAAGANYVIGVEAESALNAPVVPDTLGNNQGSKTDDDFVFTQIQLGYQAVPPIGLPATETTAAAGAISAGANGPNSWVGLYLFGPKAITSLASVASGTASTVTITIQLKGALRSGETMTSNTFAYPVTVFNSGTPACPTGVRPALNGPCGSIGSQDGTRLTCCSAADGGTLPTGC